MEDGELGGRVEAVRRFSRFYTRQIGVLNEGLLRSPFSLAEARVMYELAQRGRATATELAADLRMDAGYLSRMVRSFAKRGLVEKEPVVEDGRSMFLSLTEAGQKAFALLNGRSQEQIAEILGRLSKEEQKRLVQAMGVVEKLMGEKVERGSERLAGYVLRPPQPGDMGWVVHRHGVLYGEEYGWDEQFEALVASIVAQFVQNFDVKRERCWIAEMDGEVVGSVFLVRQSDAVAKLRLLYVEPKARGLGIGGRLVEECVRFGRRAGYEKMVLWTNSVLVAARHIYVKAGFRLVEEEAHHSFGHDLVGENWELAL